MVHLRAFTESDIPQLAKLHKKVFSSRRSVEALVRLHRWRYLENPWGALRGAAACEGESLVGAYLLIPIKVAAGSTVRQVYQNATILVHPRCRGQGLAERLLDQTAAQLTGEGYSDEIIDFPNESSERAHQKYFAARRQAYRIITTHCSYRIPLTPFGALSAAPLRPSARLALRAIDRPLAKLFRPRTPPGSLRPDPDVEVSEISQLPEDYGEFWSRVRKSLPACFEREESFMRWRYLSYPEPKIKLFTCRKDRALVGCFALETRRREQKILDAFCDAKKLSPAALQALAVARASREGCSHITFSANTDPHVLRLLTGIKNVLVDAVTPFYGFSLSSSDGSNGHHRSLAETEWFLSASEIELG